MGTFNSTNFGNLPWGYQNQPIPTLTGADLAYTAYRIAGILPEPGRGYSQSEAWDALKVLNSLIDSMLAERLMVWAYLRTQWVTTANKGEYTVGNTIVNGKQPDWYGIPRPEEITLAGYVFTNTQPQIEQQMKVLTYQEWAALSPKNLTSSIPYMLYFRADVPNGTIFLWPVPTDPSVQIALYTWLNVQRIPALTTQLILPPAYQELLEYGLAIRLAGMFPRRSKLDPNAPRMYDQARTKVMSANEPKLQMRTELAAGGAKQAKGQFNIITGGLVGGGGWPI